MVRRSWRRLRSSPLASRSRICCFSRLGWHGRLVSAGRPRIGPPNRTGHFLRAINIRRRFRYLPSELSSLPFQREHLVCEWTDRHFLRSDGHAVATLHPRPWNFALATERVPLLLRGDGRHSRFGFLRVPEFCLEWQGLVRPLRCYVFKLVDWRLRGFVLPYSFSPRLCHALAQDTPLALSADQAANPQKGR